MYQYQAKDFNITDIEMFIFSYFDLKAQKKLSQRLGQYFMNHALPGVPANPELFFMENDGLAIQEIRAIWYSDNYSF